MKKALSYDDVTLVPNYSEVMSREDPDTSVQLGGFKMSVPIISANMDTVTECHMAAKLWRLGAAGALHRFMSVVENVDMYERVLQPPSGSLVPRNCFVSVGTTDWKERLPALFEAGARHVIIDVAHGHSKMMRETLEGIRKEFGFDIYLMAGNVATPEAAIDLAKWGANAVKVGVGGGSACKTRVVTGHGVPMFSSVLEVCEGLDRSDVTADVIADGGIRSSGDIVKALVAGAHAVMVGGLFAGCDEAPGCRTNGKKAFRGMSSHDAQREMRSVTGKLMPAEEGVSTYVENKGSVEALLNELSRGIKSGLSYSGALTLDELRAKARWREQTVAGFFEGTPHVLKGRQ